MSAEVLRQAAARIRHDVEFGQAHGEDGFLLAVARWLDDESYAPETDIGNGITTGGPRMEALAVANAYLGNPT